MMAYLIGKGKSLDRLDASWFDDESPIWAINQSSTVIAEMFPNREIHCIQNDNWINYTPPQEVIWHCTPSVDAHGRSVQRYIPETLTGKWGSPTCVNALHLMRAAGITEIIMVGFDSFFDRSRDYAACLNVESDKVAPFEAYNTIMRRYADASGIKLTWMDADGILHDDDHAYKKAIIAVAIGDKYERQTDRMLASFLSFNAGWEVVKYYGENLDALLPESIRSWSAFNRCEIGRWYGMKKALEGYDTALYADGDIRWYGEYKEDPSHTMVLTPHYTSNHARNDAKHWIMKDGAANIGIMEINRSVENDGIFDLVIGEVLHRPSSFMHGDQLWLQCLVSCLPACGYDVVYSIHAGLNVASWNLRYKDRSVFSENGEYKVKSANGEIFPLVAFHFSSKSIVTLPRYGKAVNELLKGYQDEK